MIKKILRKIIYWATSHKSVVNSNISELSSVLSPCKLIAVNMDDFSYIAPGADMANVKIGKFCSIGPYCIAGKGIHPTNGLSTSPVFYSSSFTTLPSFSKYDKVVENKQIIIGNDVFIGAGVNILDGVTIGHGAIVGASTLVSKDIPPYAIVVGTPMKIVKYRFDEETIAKLLKVQWWNFETEDLTKVERYFYDINGFINNIE